MDKDLDIFDFEDYRAYLNAWLKRKKESKTFNLTRLSEVAQIHPTFLSHVLSGAKHLSLEQAALISDQLEHTKLEQDFFFVLIHLDRAGNQKLRNYWLEKKAQFKTEKLKLSKRLDKHRVLTQEERALFYSSWIYVAVWVSTSIEDRQTLSQVAERFQITRNRADEILKFLVEIGLCKVKEGHYSMTENHIHIPNDSPFVVKHHVNWRMKGIQKMDNRKEYELFFTSPMSIAKKDFHAIREKIARMIKEIINTAKASAAEEVVCLNVDFFEQTE